MSLVSKLLSASGGVDKIFSEDVFSAYTYTGNGSTQTITNGIDLAGKGGLVWTKDRINIDDHWLSDTVRGVSSQLRITTDSAYPFTSQVTAFNANGFSIGGSTSVNGSGKSYASWTFRKAPKFFDVVTFTGTGSSQLISHSLGQIPGMLIFKRTDSTSDWNTLARKSDGSYAYLAMNTTVAQFHTAADATAAGLTSSTFNPGVGFGTINGATYVAYLFAHDTSTDGIIQCGSFTTDASGDATVMLGWEPQFVLHKSSSTGDNWMMFDASRGMTATGFAPQLSANSSVAENTTSFTCRPNATGFSTVSGLDANNTFIYLAIRRPNKPPTLGTQVYNAIARTGTGAAATVTGVGFAPDLGMSALRNGISGFNMQDRLRGSLKSLLPTSTAAEATETNSLTSFNMDGVSIGVDTLGYWNISGFTLINHFFKRAPGTMEEICYSGTGSNKTEIHNLTKVPSLVIVKSRSSTNDWNVWCEGLSATEKLVLNSTAAKVTDATAWNSILPSSTLLSLGTASGTNASAVTYVAYLLGNAPGIQKIGTYIGDGTTGKLIDCGFTTGSRFVCIKAISTTGNWLIADSVRGITSGNDPYLALNSTAAEITTEDWLDPTVSGFLVNQVSASNANVNGVTYLYWSIA